MCVCVGAMRCVRVVLVKARARPLLSLPAPSPRISPSILTPLSEGPADGPLAAALSGRLERREGGDERGRVGGAPARGGVPALGGLVAGALQIEDARVGAAEKWERKTATRANSDSTYSQVQPFLQPTRPKHNEPTFAPQPFSVHLLSPETTSLNAAGVEAAMV